MTYALLHCISTYYYIQSTKHTLFYMILPCKDQRSSISSMWLAFKVLITLAWSSYDAYWVFFLLVILLLLFLCRFRINYKLSWFVCRAMLEFYYFICLAFYYFDNFIILEWLCDKLISLFPRDTRPWRHCFIFLFLS